jgi:carbamoyl-phosphate synthase large subunit
MKRLTVAVTGLNATDNPGPGVGVLRALQTVDRYRLVGLAYDALDPGVYATDVADDVFIMPYPSQGMDSLVQRLAYIKERVGLDVVVPTLDAELPPFIDASAQLAAMGIRTLLPSRAQLDARAKARLGELGRTAGLPVPREALLGGVGDLLRVHERIAYPFYIKGPFYGATLVRSYDEAIAAYYRALAQWGGPIIAQEQVHGIELNVAAVGDGEGGMLGAVAMKKLVLTDKGKGWAGVTILDEQLMELAASFLRATRWPGACELEVMRSPSGAYHLIEVNPRFPAWIYLSAAADTNLPDALVRLAAGERVMPLGAYAVGRMFVRIAIDQVTTMDDFARVATAGEVLRTRGVA